ncbi:phosphoglucosamine mutase [Haloferula chungangensis]|uniref:Phosphoglucosamine mutase n=1 Tax=Haloferula chungangensis TaxID=1048331 RepID=A0ABW2LD63_9BACT
MKLFGTDGIRGRANEYPITPEVALRAGKAVAEILRSGDPARNRVVIGKDTRISGTMLESALTSGLVSMGIDVLLPGALPTPAIAHLTKSMGCAAGIMLTASHNPFEDNGLKIFGPGGHKLSDELEALIESHILGEKPEAAATVPERIGKVQIIEDASGRYIEYAKQTADNISLHGLKIVIDCGHGAAWSIAPPIFEELGATVITTGCEPNGININAGCGALHPEKAGELVRSHQADLGVSFDGDADRVIFTDATGTAVSGDRVIALCALALKDQDRLTGNTIAATVMSNLGLHEAMRREGIEVITTQVGDRHVLEALRNHGFSFGGENSGHLIFADHATTGDGILSALQVLGMMKRRGASLAELAACMDEFPQQLLNLRVNSKPPLDDLAGLQKLIAEADESFGDSGRQLIRYSGTENKIRILVEHRDAATVDLWIEKFAACVKEEIGVPA